MNRRQLMLGAAAAVLAPVAASAFECPPLPFFMGLDLAAPPPVSDLVFQDRLIILTQFDGERIRWTRISEEDFLLEPMKFAGLDQ